MKPTKPIIFNCRQPRVSMLITLRVLLSVGIGIWVALVLVNIISNTAQVVRTGEPLDIEGIPRRWITTVVFLALQVLLISVCLYLIRWGNRRVSQMAQTWRAPTQKTADN